MKETVYTYFILIESRIVIWKSFCPFKIGSVDRKRKKLQKETGFFWIDWSNFGFSNFFTCLLSAMDCCWTYYSVPLSSQWKTDINYKPTLCKREPQLIIIVTEKGKGKEKFTYISLIWVSLKIKSLFENCFVL